MRITQDRIERLYDQILLFSQISIIEDGLIIYNGTFTVENFLSINIILMQDPKVSPVA